MAIKVISFDMFQTLVDVNKRTFPIWRELLGDEFSDTNCLYGCQTILDCYPAALHKALTSDRFHTMQEVYLNCAKAVVQRTGFRVTPEDLVRSLVHQHSLAPVYEDVIHCMRKLKNTYKIILSSDSNHRMIDALIGAFTFDELFISDDLQVYKADPKGRFFGQVVDRLGVKPEEILHIGDSSSDIIGASLVGVKSCWINREKRQWEHELQPDYQIESLYELDRILSPHRVSFGCV